MKEKNYWDKFTATGKIEDYLSFKNSAWKHTEEQPGDKAYAGLCDSDGNRTDVSAYRGIR